MPRKNRTNAVTEQPTAQEPAVDIKALVEAQVSSELLKQQERRTVDIFHCRSCYKQSDNASPVGAMLCRYCENFGFQADLFTFSGRKLGMFTGIPVDIIEILSKTLTEQQIWDSSPEELASHWDANSVELLPTKMSDVPIVYQRGEKIRKDVAFSDYVQTPPRLRPPTEQERNEYLEQARKQKEQDTARRSASRRKNLERNLFRAQEAMRQP